MARPINLPKCLRKKLGLKATKKKTWLKVMNIEIKPL